MKPYYSHAGITIYHADCRDVLPGLVADVVITDPPYGVDLGRHGREVEHAAE
jgi:site-specific DNA-methyltransferase (adenine-specific)